MLRLHCRTLSFLSVLLAVTASGAAGQADALSDYDLRHSWFSRDKLYHFGVSAAGAGALYAGGRAVGLKRWQAALASAAVTGTAGMLREVVQADPDDLLTRGKLSRKDLWWDGVGIVVGISIADPLTRRREPETQKSRSGLTEGSPSPPPPCGALRGAGADSVALGSALERRVVPVERRRCAAADLPVSAVLLQRNPP